MIHLQALQLRPSARAEAGYPFSLPLVQRLDSLTFRAPVTFFVGENGTGKSTILEAIAAASGAVTVGGADIAQEKSARRLAAHLALAWRKRVHRGFFLRAEDFFNFASGMARLVQELEAMAADYEGRLQGYGLSLAQGAARAQRAALIARYGEDLHARSHGESFMQVFQARFVPGGLYLLDEPDTALSPQRQLALLAMLKDMVAQEAQFIIATHSPILMAYPGATILSFDGQEIAPVAYDEVQNVILSRSFLANPAAFLRHL